MTKNEMNLKWEMNFKKKKVKNKYDNSTYL